MAGGRVRKTCADRDDVQTEIFILWGNLRMNWVRKRRNIPVVAAIEIIKAHCDMTEIKSRCS